MARKRVCNVTGCSAEQCAVKNEKTKELEHTGVCRKHWDENYRLECMEEGCDRRPFSKGRCQAHYMRIYRKKRDKAKVPPGSVPVRAYRDERFEVFTRISQEDAETILRANGHEEAMYTAAAQILAREAARLRRREAQSAA